MAASDVRRDNDLYSDGWGAGRTTASTSRASPDGTRRRGTRKPSRALVQTGVHEVLFFFAATGIVLGVSLFHFYARPEISFSVFYLVPIALVAWFGSGRQGLAVAIISAAAWSAAEHFSTPTELAWTILCWNGLVRLVFFVVTVAMVRFGAALKSERHLAMTDPVTGIANRRAFLQVLQLESDRALRTGSPLTLAYIDIDDFKQINDELGHGVGDLALKTTAEIASCAVRVYDTVARVGGDEFALLLPGMGAKAAAKALDEFHGMLTWTSRRAGWNTTFSVGAVTYLSALPNVHEMLQRADGLLYEVKRNGKDGVRHAVYGAPEPVLVPRI